MNRVARPACRGFTLLEVAIGVVVSTVAMGSFVALWSSSDDLSTQSRTALQGEGEHRANLAAIGSLFRDAAPASLAGFDVNGRATSPRFRRVVGYSGGTQTLDSEQELLWQPVSAWGVDDLGAPLGQVVARVGSTDRVLARRVPEGGFVVQRSGRTLTVTLATYWQPEERGPHRRTHDEFEVCLRN
jgi:prepilin-type N-terminal cleavage/methylation domain-containing protein